MIRGYFRRPDAAELAVLTVVLVIVFSISYAHLRAAWEAAAGGPGSELAWTAVVGPLSVDGLLAAAWLKMRSRRRDGEAVGLLAWTALYLSIGATIAGNVAGASEEWLARHADELAPWVAAWPAVAFALVFELLVGRGNGRRVAEPEPEQDPRESAVLALFTKEELDGPGPEPERAAASALAVPAGRVQLVVADPPRGVAPDPEPARVAPTGETFRTPSLDLEGRRRLVQLFEQGAGRGTLEKELALTEKQARTALEKLRAGLRPAGLESDELAEVAL